MKIAVLGSKTYPALAGADRVAENILHHLPADPPHHYILYTIRTPEHPSPWTPAPNIRVVPIPAIQGKHAQATTYFILSALHCALIAHPDLAHLHDSATGPFAWILRILRPRMPLLGTFHGNPYERAKWSRFAKAFLRFSDSAFIRACHRLTTVARAKVADVQARSKTPIAFIPNGVQPAPTIPSTDLLSRHHLAPQQYALFAAGRMDPTKGLHHLLDAWQTAASPLPLVVIGGFEGHHQAYSEQILARCRSIPNLILIPDLLPQPQLYEFLANTALFIFPSEVEAMSMILLEAISCGAPVLASDIPENTEVTGTAYPWLFRNADPAHLAQQLARFFRDGPGPEIPALRQHIATHYNWTAIARHYLDLYHTLRPQYYDSSQS